MISDVRFLWSMLGTPQTQVNPGTKTATVALVGKECNHRMREIPAKALRQRDEAHLRPAHGEAGKDMQDVQRRHHGDIAPAPGA